MERQLLWRGRSWQTRSKVLKVFFFKEKLGHGHQAVGAKGFSTVATREAQNSTGSMTEVDEPQEAQLKPAQHEVIGEAAQRRLLHGPRVT